MPGSVTLLSTQALVSTTSWRANHSRTAPATGAKVCAGIAAQGAQPGAPLIWQLRNCILRKAVSLQGWPLQHTAKRQHRPSETFPVKGVR